MKNILILFAIFFGSIEVSFAQYSRLSYPRNWSVYQRGSDDAASVPFAGQMLFTSGSVPAGAVVTYRTRKVDINGSVISTGPWETANLSSTGMFYSSIYRTTGWYYLEVYYNGWIQDNIRFGVGDVFVLAGQSNAQGFGSETDWTVPSTAGFPEWIVAATEEGNCTNLLPSDATNNIRRIGGFEKIGPTGNNSWCYAKLGQLLSADVTGGLPVAFFNAASGGSTITQWYNGAKGLPAPNGYRSGAQFCDGLGYTGPFIGQPYTPLKTALNYYAAQFGVRAVLWHQGEADGDAALNAMWKTTSSADYKTKLDTVINVSRRHFSPNLSWIVSNASLSTTAAGVLNPPSSIVRNGQTSVVNPATARYAGPDTDYETGTSNVTTNRRKDGTHFENSAAFNYGLEFLALKWKAAIGTNGFKIGRGFVPNVTYTVLEETRTLTAPSGYPEYRWGANINNPIPGATSRTFVTETPQTIRCFIRDNTGNWHVSALITIGATPGTRLSAESPEATNGEYGVSLNVYPNPVGENFMIEFSVPNDNAVVSMSIMDTRGNVIRRVVDNPHAKGNWKYPVKDLHGKPGEIYLCHLRVDELSVVKKIVIAK